MKALSLIQPLKDWDKGIKKRFPDKSTRSIELAKAVAQFNTHVSSFSKDNNTSQPDAQKAVINRVSQECNAELVKLKNYVPPQQTVRSEPTENITKKPIASPKASVDANRKPEKKIVTSKPDNYPDSPFHKGIFNPGWKGDLSWAGSEKKERMVLHSFDEAPTYSKAWQIHANARIYGANARKHCIGHLVEFDRSPDGLTLYMKPSEDGGCGGQNRIVSINAVAADNIRFEVRQDNAVIAAGNLWPHNRSKLLVLKSNQEVSVMKAETIENKSNVDATKPRTEVATSDNIAKTNHVTKNAIALTEATETTPCLTCLPIDERATDIANSPFYPGIFDQPWSAVYRDFSQKIEKSVKIVRKTESNVDNALLTLQIEYKPKHSDACVGELREVGRSVSGYIIHFEVQSELKKTCKTKMTHAYVWPSVNRDGSRYMGIRFYNNKLISSWPLTPSAKTPQFQVDPVVAKQAKSVIYGLDQRIADDKRREKDAAFEASKEYPKILPLYQACMREPKKYGVQLLNSYCQCVSEKVGIGGRFSDEALAEYARDFSSLKSKLHDSDENKLLFRLGEMCMSCSLPSNELEPWCSGQDPRLYVASNYKQMIRLLETGAPQIDATDYYKKLFYRTYLQRYSVFCKDNIRDPVPFTIVETETTIGGPFSGESRVTDTDTTMVERRYAAKYERFLGDIKRSNAAIFQERFLAELRSMGTEKGLIQKFREVKTTIALVRERYGALNLHLQNRCDSKPVRTAYKNLLNLVD